MTHYTKLFFILILCFFFLGCEEKSVYRIGVSQCSEDDWRNKMNDEIQREIMLHPEATVEIRSADDNNKKQIEDIRYFWENKFDIIVVAPNEAKAITPIIKEVYKSGIPILLFDRDIIGDTYTAKIGVNNKLIGEHAAKYARQITKKGAKVLEICGRKGSTPAENRYLGFQQEAKKQGLQVVASAYGNWNYEDAKTVTDSILKSNNDIDVIFAHNDRMAIGASKVARSRGRKLKVIGVDAAPEIGIKAVNDGVIDATFLYPTDGNMLMRTALAILKGEQYKRNVVFPHALPVDSTNAELLLLQNESLNAETSKVKALKRQVDMYLVEHSKQTILIYASIIIVFLLFGFLFMVLRSFWTHKRYQQELMKQNGLLAEQRDNQAKLNEQLREATRSKLIFFTNASHDLRTPLTLIAEPIEQLSNAKNLTCNQEVLINIAHKNVKILKRLINQILDFRKYENGKQELSLSEVCVAQLMKEWSQAFVTIAKRRQIKFNTDIKVEETFTMALDTEKMERIFFNILSNAFKYTPDNGSISITSDIVDNNLVLSFEDNGKGISPEDTSHIFDRFYQVDKIHPNGSGIGLSLTKAFVELHGGDISIESLLGKGSKFTVTLPIKHVEADKSTTVNRTISDEDVKLELNNIEVTNDDEIIQQTDDDLPLVLVIDDNEDICKMISILLQQDYRIIEAANGKEGIRLASKYTPDLIICDVMMPVMDGIECCKQLKNEVSTSHIPILMLTACSMDEQRLLGYKSGADGYLTKPFNDDMLKIRCANLIANRRRIKNIYSGDGIISTDMNASTTAIHHEDSTIDNEFYDSFIKIVNAEMGNSDLSIDDIATRLGVGRSQFYRKIKALTNFSPVELLRNIRLKHARDLLIKTEKSISEIAYEVGFSSPAYFTRCYKELFDEKPSEIRERLGHR